MNHELGIYKTINALSMKVNELGARIDEMYNNRANVNASGIEANAEGVDTLGEVTDETVTGLGDLAEYVAELEARIEMLEEA